MQIDARHVITEELHLSLSLCVLTGICAQGQVSKHALRAWDLMVLWTAKWSNGENCLKLGITKVRVPLFRVANCTLRFGKGVNCFIEPNTFILLGAK